MIPSEVLVQAVALQTKSPEDFLENLGVCQIRVHMPCRPQESIRPASSWKGLWSVAWVRCWRQPITGAVKTLYSWRSCLCQES